MPFSFSPLNLPDLILVEPQAFEDERGYFKDTYAKEDFISHGIETEFAQVSYSLSMGRVIRGLHFQAPPRPQGKLVCVLQGEIFDVAVDIRIGSPTYAQWTAITLSDQNHRCLWIPPGFAHGFCVLKPPAGVLYKMTDEYVPALYKGIAWNDPSLAIEWPFKEPLISKRDSELPYLAASKTYFTFEDIK